VIPSPHPLDFDWRFDSDTLDRLQSRVAGLRVLALGAPSLARRLEANRQDVLLVDRQPWQGVRDHLVCELPLPSGSVRTFDVAVVDPPWYPKELSEWSSMAGRWVGPGGTVLVSAWPDDARPGASEQLRAVLAGLSSWATVEDIDVPLGYEIPDFERTARLLSPEDRRARSPGMGRLIRLKVGFVPPAERQSLVPPSWHRFALDGYQLAVRLGTRCYNVPLITPHPMARDWLWPFVSATAPGRSDIGIWSSAGEVALVSDPARLIEILRSAIHSGSTERFEAALATVPELIGWKIPHPPHTRVLEWQHQ
jgi:hypothetical protein